MITMKNKITLIIMLVATCAFANHSMHMTDFVRAAVDSNYNVKIGSTAENQQTVGGFDFTLSWDLFYVRVTRDFESDWQFRCPMMFFFLNIIGMQDMNKEKAWLFNPGYSLKWFWLNLPMMLMNPTVSVEPFSWLKFGVGYESEFYSLSWFSGSNEIYFAPKVLTTIMFGSKVHVTLQANYQVKDFFATSKGWHFTMGLATWFKNVKFGINDN